MPNKHQAIGVTINFVTLLIGLTIGFLAGTSNPLERVVLAQSAETQDKPEVEEISPGLTTGAIGVHTLLAGRIATDSIMVKGIDLIKLHENTLNLLLRRKYVTISELNTVLEQSRAKTILKMKVPEKEEKK